MRVAVFAVALIAALGITPVVYAQAPNLELMDIVLKSVPDGPVAIVNKQAISAQEFKDLYMGEVLRWAQLNPGKPVDDQTRLGIALNGLRMLIEREVLYQEAVARKLNIPQAELEAKWQEELDALKKAASKDGNAELTEADLLKKAGATREEALAELRKALLVETVRESIMKDKGVTVTDQEVSQWYEENRDLTRRPDMMHLKQIFVQAGKNIKEDKRAEARKKAQDAYDRIRAGQSFEGVAKAVSEGRYKDEGGDWGLLPVSEFPPFIVEAANKLKPGDVSTVIESEWGFHILKLIEVVAGEETSLDKAAPEIRRMLLAKKGSEAIHEFTSKVTANPEALQVFLDLEKQIQARPDLQKDLSTGTPPAEAKASEPAPSGKRRKDKE